MARPEMVARSVRTMCLGGLQVSRLTSRPVSRLSSASQPEYWFLPSNSLHTIQLLLRGDETKRTTLGQAFVLLEVAQDCAIENFGSHKSRGLASTLSVKKCPGSRQT